MKKRQPRKANDNKAAKRTNDQLTSQKEPYQILMYYTTSTGGCWKLKY